MLLVTFLACQSEVFESSEPTNTDTAQLELRDGDPFDETTDTTYIECDENLFPISVELERDTLAPGDPSLFCVTVGYVGTSATNILTHIEFRVFGNGVADTLGQRLQLHSIFNTTDKKCFDIYITPGYNYPPGNYFIQGIIDANQAFNECNESDNFTQASFTVI